MREHRGYPIALGGVNKYVAKRLGAVRTAPPQFAASPIDGLLHDATSDTAVSYSVEALGTRLEHAILQKARPRTGDGAELALRQAIGEDAQFFSGLLAFRSDDERGIVEFEFGVVGYPGTYTKRVRLAGVAGESPVERTRFADDADDLE